MSHPGTGNAGRYPRVGNRWVSTVWRAAWVYFAIALVVAIILHWAGDSYWQMTLLTFGPRWVFLLPLFPLAVGAGSLCRRALLPVLLAVVCVLGPVMGYCIPWRSITQAAPQHGQMLRMVTLNIDGATDVPMLIQFLREVKPDVVAFQEGPPAALLLDEMKGDFFMARGYDTFVASRHPIVKQTLAPEASNHPYYSPATRFDIAIPAGIVHVNCLHLYSLRKGLESVANVWWDGASELERVTAIRNEESQISARFAKESGGPTVVLGDFNMTSDSTVFDRDWHDWQNAFAIRGFGLGYTFATSRIGLRIDHVLADQRHWHIRSCRVGPDLHGQHRPVIAELILLENAIARRELQPPSMSSQASPSRKKSPP